ncbi:unnamed protein product [Rotaria sordida]|uniref:Uncharacterized protein n=1 Tax=Rotaria sordida TaxID=392033 RepID=A0A819GHB4_9BILA|nr:unnamed protein product [Rotaria sordida]CAF3886292.1 unnamed protein product [Rotaria sordida]
MNDAYEHISTIYATKTKGKFDFYGLFNDSDTNRSKEFEFLIENQLDLQLLPNDTITLFFQNSDKKIMTYLLIRIMIDGKTERQDGIFIVQIKLNENQQRNNLAWKGNTDQVFHYDDIITISGKEKQFDVFVDNQPYAVYYQ